MQLDDCFELGYVVRTHGTKGEVQVYLDVDDPKPYYEMESVFVAHGNSMVPFFIESILPRGKELVIKFEDVDSPDDASILKSRKLFLPLDQLPELKGDQFYYHEIIGFDIIDEILGQLGKVKETYLKGNQDLIVMAYKNTEVLIPITDDIILSIDRKSHKLFVNLPEGLLDIYLK